LGVWIHALESMVWKVVYVLKLMYFWIDIAQMVDYHYIHHSNDSKCLSDTTYCLSYAL